MSARSLTPGITADAAIVGGGVIGLTIARALAMRGVRNVMLIERGSPGAEASWAAGGILAPQVEADHESDLFRLACASRDLYGAFADALREETGADVELDRTGTLYLGFTREDEGEFRRRFTWQTEKGLRIDWLNSHDAHQLEPQISNQVRCALRFPNDIQVDNRKLIKALAKANQKLGVRVANNCEVSAVRINLGRVSGIETSGGHVSVPVIVLAAGAWNSFIKSPDAFLPEIRIEPVRGQMLCFKNEPALARHVIYSSSGYLVPRRDGRVLAGSTSEHAGFEKRVTDEGINAIKAMASEIIPELNRLPLIDSWAGFRPRAADDLPVLGPCQAIEGLFYATGHYRNGILLAPITGDLIADAIVNGVTSTLLVPFSPDRHMSEARP